MTVMTVLTQAVLRGEIIKQDEMIQTERNSALDLRPSYVKYRPSFTPQLDGEKHGIYLTYSINDKVSLTVWEFLRIHWVFIVCF